MKAEEVFGKASSLEGLYFDLQMLCKQKILCKQAWNAVAGNAVLPLEVCGFVTFSPWLTSSSGGHFWQRSASASSKQVLFLTLYPSPPPGSH